MEIEVENVSDKPIYFINAVLAFPDDPAPNGSSGILFKFGNIENMDIRKIAYTEDERLDRGEKVTLVVENIYRKGLLARQKRYPHNFKKLEFWFGSISFGDGTGFQGTQFLDLRKKSHSMNRQIKVKGLAKSQKAAAKNHCLRSVKLRTLKSSEPRASSDPRRMAAALAVPFYP